MLRVMVTFMIASLLGFGAGPTFVLRSASPTPDDQRIEQPAKGFALTFPADWRVEEYTERGLEWLKSSGVDTDFGTPLLWAGNVAVETGTMGCNLWDITPYAVSPPSFISVEDYVDFELWAASRDPGVMEFDSMLMDLPSGKTACIDMLFDNGLDNRDYIFTDMKTWFSLSCGAVDPPDDRWLSIAETFEFLPTDE